MDHQQREIDYYNRMMSTWVENQLDNIIIDMEEEENNDDEDGQP